MAYAVPHLVYHYLHLDVFDPVDQALNVLVLAVTVLVPADLAVRPAAGRVPDLAGPERHDLADLVSQVARARRVRTWVVPVRLPGRLGRGLATGALLPEADADIGRQTFAEWLAVNPRPKLASTGRP